MKRYSSILILVILMLVSCKGTSVDKSKNTTPVEAVDPLIELCNGIDYTDTVALHNPAVMKRLMARIVKLLPVTDTVTADTALCHFFSKISLDDKAIENALEFAELYLNNPMSPVRNEDRYIRVLNSMLSVNELPVAVRLPAEDKLKIASLNRPGSVATDFEFVDRDGNRRSLHRLQGDRIMVIFYDPECSHCSDILEIISDNEKINNAIAENLITVLAVYAEGKKEVWNRTCRDMPSNWIVGYDLSGILDNEMYDLPAMPIIYILDSEKRVLLKDPDYDKL